MRYPAGVVLFVCACAVAPAAAFAEDACATVARTAYADIPRYFYGSDPDSLYGKVLAWEVVCGDTEVVVRTRILAAIWDDAFDEYLYDETIVDHLAEHRRVLEKGPDPRSDDARESYDAFTVELADQLLPHTDRGSLEEFFCLFYSGRVTKAWTLLDSEELADTDLAAFRTQEREMLAAPRTVLVIALTGGGWWPQGDMAFVGDKPVVGGLVGLHGRDWLGRIVVEYRIGRANRPYWVDAEGITGWSDRFDAALVGVELGRILARVGPWSWSLFGGIGGDFVKPFKDEDLVLGTVNGSAGLGLRWQGGPSKNLLVGLDVRREWLADRNTAGTPLGGRAWSVRLVLGFLRDEGRTARLQALQP